MFLYLGTDRYATQSGIVRTILVSLLMPPPKKRVFAGKLVGLGLLYSVSCIKSIPTHEKNSCCRKKVAQMPLFNLLFFLWVGLALGWGVRRFHNNILPGICLPTQHNLANRNYPNVYIHRMLLHTPSSCVRTERYATQAVFVFLVIPQPPLHRRPQIHI